MSRTASKLPRNQHQQRRRREQLRDARTRHALHAFDYDKVRDHCIVVRRAKPSEKIRTLDGIERTLDTGICMICDAMVRAVALRIMGGAKPKSPFHEKCVDRVRLVRPIAIRRDAHPETSHEASTVSARCDRNGELARAAAE